MGPWKILEDLKVGSIPTVTPIEQVLETRNCGRVIDCGKEASSQSCKVTDRNPIQGRCGQASEPTITKPSSFICIGKSGACAAKAMRLIQGDPPHVSAGPFNAAMPPCRQAEPSSVNDVGVRRKSAEVVVLFDHTPLVTGRTEPARTGWSYRCTHAEDLLRPELTGVAFIDQPTLGAFLVDALLL